MHDELKNLLLFILGEIDDFSIVFLLNTGSCIMCDFKKYFLLILVFLLFVLLLTKANAQSLPSNFLKSTPVYGLTPAATIPTVTDTSTTPLEVVGNPYSQMNNQMRNGKGRLDWYGSGDVNGDGKVDSTDLALIESGTVANYRSDVNGDGVTNSEDATMIKNYLDGKIAYLPGYWNKLQTRAERVSWLDKMMALNNLDSQVPVLDTDSGWICTDIATQLALDNTGIANKEEFYKTAKPSSKIGSFMDGNYITNIPMYFFGTVSNDGLHAIDGVLVGDSSTGNMDWKDFNAWYKVSDYASRDRLNIQPGDPEMEDGPVSVGLEAYVKYPYVPNPVFDDISYILGWTLKDGVAALDSSNTLSYVVNENPNNIKVSVDKSLSDLTVDMTNAPKGQALTPLYLEANGYDAIPNYSNENTTLSPNLSYFDSDTTYSADSSSFSFDRQYFSWDYEGGITKVDSMTTPQKITATNITGVTDVKKPGKLEFKLEQNYPNPFNPSTTIKYSVPKTGMVTIKVYDMLGREVATLINKNETAGNYSVQFDSQQTTEHKPLPSGVYVYRMQAGSYVETKKLILLK